MIVIDFEPWAASQGASRQGYGDAGMHSPAAHVGEANWRAKLSALETANAVLAARREALRIEYDRLCAAGIMRPQNYKERMMATANGHPDNASTQAARRICLRKNYPYWEN